MKDCNVNISNEFYAVFEIITFVFFDVLRALSHYIFASNARGFFMGFGDSMPKCWPWIFWPLTLVFSLAMAASTSTVGEIRDAKYINSCDTEIKKRFEIVNAHAVVKAFARFSTLVISFYASAILYNSICKWKKAYQNIKYALNKWDGSKKELRKAAKDNLYHLHAAYIKVGKDTSLERNALTHWFMLMNVTYFGLVLVNLVHITWISSKGIGKDIFDIIHANLSTGTFLTDFLIPWFLATWLNKEHCKYYREMLNMCLEIEIAHGGEEFLCSLGNDMKKIRKPHEGDNEGALLLQKSEWITLANQNDEVEDLYKDYYREVWTAPGYIIENKKEEFEFVPSFMYISIPVNSPGYAFTILISVFSIVLRFASMHS